MDQVLAFVNAGTSTHNVTMRYATLSEFFNAVTGSGPAVPGGAWPTRDQTDFFPYSDEHESTWTGYYTSRVALKGYARSREAWGRAAEQLHVLTNGTAMVRVAN